MWHKKRFLLWAGAILFFISMSILSYFLFLEELTQNIDKPSIVTVEKSIEMAPTEKAPISISEAAPRRLINDVPGTQVCPSLLEVDYFVDSKQTRTPADDDIYVGIRNNNQLPEKVNIEIDDYNEGSLDVNGLGLSLKKSIIMTNWWRPLILSNERTFLALIEPEKCLAMSATLTLKYPQSEGDYFD